MKRKIALFAGALTLVFAAGTAQAHGSLFGVFFKHHAHYACGHHHNDHGPALVYKHVKAKKKHTHSYHHGHHGHADRLIW